MSEGGRLTDVIVTDRGTTITKDQRPYDLGLEAWADEGNRDTIKSVPGVHSVLEFGTHYFITLDERYERDWVMKEIEATLKIRGTKESE